MQPKEVKIEIYNKEEEFSTTLYVERISENIFQMIDNDVFDCRLTLGTEFETKINDDGKHEIIKILKKSHYTTRRFLLNAQIKESEYRLLGDEIIKQGGFWQVDFGGIITINLPENSTLNIDQILKLFDFKPIEIND